MSKMDEKTPLFSAPSADTAGPEPIWEETKNRKNFKLMLGGFLAFIILNLLVSSVMVAVQSWRETKLFVLLLVSLLVFAQVPFFMVVFIYKECVGQKHFYAVFVTGIAVVIECLATDILVFVTT